MAITVKQYLDYFRLERYHDLLDEESMTKLHYVEEKYGTLETEETILEVRLSENDRTCDYSIRVDVEHPTVTEYWYELDSNNCKKENISPCYFMEAMAVEPGKDNEEFYQSVLVKLAGENRVAKLRPMIEKCVAALEGKCKTLYQFGAMTGRTQNQSIRMFTNDMKRSDFVSYLKEIEWNGDLKALDAFLEEWEAYSDKGMFILDFDIYENAISEKIGINFGTRKKTPASIETVLTAFENKGLCLSDKKQDVLRFVKRYPSHTPFIQNDISHFKIPFQGKTALQAKAYLRVGSDCFYQEYRAYDTPALMNLELTTRCPLRCPQCYCDLNRGKDMELQSARYWIKEAASCGVTTVNLSGGETMCYPYLRELISLCSEKGMEANIAISGFGINKTVLKELIDAGVADICVSLNGSTEEINAKTRDGYNLAIMALEQLMELQYSQTAINWVMHSNNAEDFENMLKLAERYQVRSLVVMIFKPDASNQLPSVPDVNQLRNIVKQIKQYKGRVSIEVEECFSQLRAMLGERFLLNLNRGINKGCGAGRDGFSVSVEGKLTPCRHLELEEEYTSLRDYWHHSKILEELRGVEDVIKEPCSGCKYKRNCLPCMAVNWKMKNAIYMGNEICSVILDKEKKVKENE